ncbi:MAG: hypothetical protein LUE12_02005 [Ruminococcus sp.]|nr:hypothetical protein [Ruminococcus sp.]
MNTLCRDFFSLVWTEIIWFLFSRQRTCRKWQNSSSFFDIFQILWSDFGFDCHAVSTLSENENSSAKENEAAQNNKEESFSENTNESQTLSDEDTDASPNRGSFFGIRELRGQMPTGWVRSPVCFL